VSAREDNRRTGPGRESSGRRDHAAGAVGRVVERLSDHAAGAVGRIAGGAGLIIAGRGAGRGAGRDGKAQIKGFTVTLDQGERGNNYRGEG
jgi:hypothetical protein